MYTQCPDCQTAFRVTAKVLQQAGGRVRCGGCGNPFSAIDHLSEELPGSVRSHPHSDDTKKRDSAIDDFEEKSRTLLETLDELAGNDKIHIEDTGVEWRVLEDVQALTESGNNLSTADADEASDQDSGVVQQLDDTTATEAEPRYDDNTPLPDDEYLPPVSAADKSETVHESEDAVDFAAQEANIELGDNEEWARLLLEEEERENNDPARDDASLIAQLEAAAQSQFDEDSALLPELTAELADKMEEVAAGADGSGSGSGRIPLEVEEELAAIHSELATTSMPNEVAVESLTDIDTQFNLQAEAMGLDISRNEAIEEMPANDEIADNVAAADQGESDDSSIADLDLRKTDLHMSSPPVLDSSVITADSVTNDEELLLFDENHEFAVVGDEAATGEIRRDESMDEGNAGTGIDNLTLEVVDEPALGPTSPSDEDIEDASTGDSQHKSIMQLDDDRPDQVASTPKDDVDDVSTSQLQLAAEAPANTTLDASSEINQTDDDSEFEAERLDTDDSEEEVSEAEVSNANDLAAEDLAADEFDDDELSPEEEADIVEKLRESTGAFQQQIAAAQEALDSGDVDEYGDSDNAAEAAPLEFGDNSDRAEVAGLDAVDANVAVNHEDHAVADPTEEELSINEEIDQELMRATQTGDLLSQTMIQAGIDPDALDPENIETIVMEGDFVHGSFDLEDSLSGEHEEVAQFDDPGFLADTYMMNKGQVRGGRRKSDPVGFGTIAAIVLLGLLLIAQYIHSSRESLAAYGAFHQTIGPVYRAFGNPITPIWDVKGWQFKTTRGSTDEDQQVLTISSQISNQSDNALPYPLVHVSLTDRWEEIIGSKVLEPSEYLAGDLDPRRPVAPGDMFTAVAVIKSPAADATGFKLNVCYREMPGTVRCATEDFKN